MSTMTDTSMSTSADTSLGKKLTFRAEAASTETADHDKESAPARPKFGRVMSRYNHLFAIHAKTRPSPLTRGDQPDAPNYNGFRNLMALVLVVSNLRLMLENFRKYGVLICIRCHDYSRKDVVYGSLLYFSVPYPQNITLKNLSYFWWAPTLVYQPVYPRTDKIRKDFVFKRLAEMASLSIVIWLASAQYAVPLLQNSLDHIAALDLVSILERVMKLSTISLFCWLAGFFLVFQSSLNALAEVMRFGDREFYGDWWNSVSIRTYWTSWNKPVYHFMKRHIYSPLVGRGVPPTLAQIIVFVFSGLLHELLVGIPTHNLLWVAFAGMMWQIPLILLTDPLMRAKSDTAKTIGNLTFWVTFCLVGQPLAALLYFFAWQAKYGSVSGKALK